MAAAYTHYTFCIVPDTNVFLEVDPSLWRGVARAFEGAGMLCECHITNTVVRELDRLKESDDAKIAGRARAALRLIDEKGSPAHAHEMQGWVASQAFEDAAVGLSWKVHARLLELPPALSRLLDVHNADDQIIAAALLVRRSVCRPTILLSNDRGLKIKARAVGVPSLELRSVEGDEAVSGIAESWYVESTRAPAPPSEPMEEEFTATGLGVQQAGEVRSDAAVHEQFHTVEGSSGHGYGAEDHHVLAVQREVQENGGFVFGVKPQNLDEYWFCIQLLDDLVESVYAHVFEEELGSVWGECLKVDRPWVLGTYFKVTFEHWHAVFLSRLFKEREDDRITQSKMERGMDLESEVLMNPGKESHWVPFQRLLERVLKRLIGEEQFRSWKRDTFLPQLEEYRRTIHHPTMHTASPQFSGEMMDTA
mmetsp:Transcript_7730/g.20084  ORF Transcript_7730/g.20084 Transcript_7730/m.20084 type:complete len:422 (-) Transcript_7730:633-1898(-)